MEDAARTARADLAGQADGYTGPRHVIHLVLLAPAGQVTEELRGVQVPLLELEGSEPDPLRSGRAAGAERFARLLEPVRGQTEQPDEPQPLDAGIIGGSQVLLRAHGD